MIIRGYPPLISTDTDIKNDPWYLDNIRVRIHEQSSSFAYLMLPVQINFSFEFYIFENKKWLEFSPLFSESIKWTEDEKNPKMSTETGKTANVRQCLALVASV